MRNPKTRRNAVGIACAAALLGAAAAGCGSDTVAVSYDCCLYDVWYVCTTTAAYGRCLPSNDVPNPGGCSAVIGSACPPDANK